MSCVEERACSWFVHSLSETNAGPSATLLQCARVLDVSPWTRGGF